ncbi:hypothetical protein [Ligilactobacillus cholophilus]|uniref:hypothetical protein n=1 Tax=Ligilactobacillus cholophilus TaxID=3050131 RepID=UPI0025B03AD7|nr:hypothetical protein [Ligilactobacillus cholophilus]
MAKSISNRIYLNVNAVSYIDLCKDKVYLNNGDYFLTTKESINRIIDRLEKPYHNKDTNVIYGNNKVLQEY